MLTCLWCNKLNDAKELAERGGQTASYASYGEKVKSVSRYAAFIKLGVMVLIGIEMGLIASFFVVGILIEIFSLSYEADLGWLMLITIPIVAPYWISFFADYFVGIKPRPWWRKRFCFMYK